MIDDPTLPGPGADATVELGSESGDQGTLPVAAGDRFGRFRVDGMLGAGGMGVVFEAHDPMLERQVAIKVMAARSTDTDAKALEARMVREAKAMARLSHPNVVRVYEAGSSRAGVFLVMELIDGTTLGRWLEEPRPWREVLARFIAAGRGLAAAHGAGLVHRDFKPANVLIGRDGRVLVSDFGLVSVGAHGGELAAAPATTPVGSGDGLDLSSGAAIGTPRYMSPEQHQRGPLDARTDQWSFCASLWEALYREHPFAADSMQVLAMRVCLDELKPPADDRGVPVRIRAALTRGLARDPVARFTSMADLLAELERDPARHRPLWLAGVGVVVLAGVAVSGWARSGRAEAAVGPCTRPPPALWSPARRTAIATEFHRIAGAAGDEAFARAAGRLESNHRRLHALQVRVCRDDDRASAEFLERVGCLTRLRADGVALVNVFAQRASGAVVDGAIAAVTSLPMGDVCLDPRARGMSIETLSPDERVAAIGLRGRLQAAEAYYRAGLFADALTAARAAVDAAVSSGSPRFEAEARLALGRALEHLSEMDASVVELRKAASLAASVGDDATVAAAWVDMVWVVNRSDRPDESLTMAPLVEAAIERAGNPPRLRADYALHHASGLVELGRYPEAMVELERSLQIWNDELDADPSAVARVLNTMANVDSYQGDDEAAIARYQRALALREGVLGPQHPDVARLLSNLGDAELRRGRTASALARCERARAILAATPALPPQEQEHAHRCIGAAQRQAGDLEAARVSLAQAVALAESTNPPSGFLPYALVEQAEVERELGRPSQALALIDRALVRIQINETDRNTFLVPRARSLNDLGRIVEARRLLELVRPDLGVGALLHAAFDFEFARALWPDREQRDRARTLAAAAEAAYAEANLTRDRDRVTAWLATHR